MLKINFLNTQATAVEIKALADSVRFESCDMMISVNKKTIDGKSKVVANKNGNYDEKEVEAAQAVIDRLEAENKKCAETQEELRNVYESVLGNMTTPNEKGFANSKDQVRTVLRLVACAENRKFYEYAPIPSLKDEELYHALEEIHVNNEVSDDGYSTNSKERVDAYKKATERLDAVVRDIYSLPVATTYTMALRVKLNKQDRKAIHDVYVKNLFNRFETDDDGVTTLASSGVTTAVKKSKKGTDYSKLSKDIAMIVIRKYAEKA